MKNPMEAIPVENPTIAQQINELESLMKSTKDSKMLKRFMVVCLFLKAYLVTQIVEITLVSKSNVYDWINAYKENGVAGLGYKRYPGFSCRLTDEQKLELKQTILDKRPSECGFPAKNNWTLKLIVAYVSREFDVAYSIGHMQKVMHELGMSYTKATYRLAKADEEKQREFAEVTLQEVKKLENGEVARILYEDEASIRGYQALGYSWFLKGEQKVVPTYGTHESVKIGGLLNEATGQVTYAQFDKFTGESFIDLLKLTMKEYPEGKSLIVVDNSKTHKSKLVNEFLKAHEDRIELLFLPPYSPNLNLIEELWKWLKGDIMRNTFFESIAEIKVEIDGFFSEILADLCGIKSRLCSQPKFSEI